jgi:biopolymer transport protein ExbD
MGMSAGPAKKDASHDQPALQGDINVTPLVDVMLVLLIIFMIVTPTLLQGFQATLPMGDNLLERPEDESRLVVGIDVEGNYYFNKKPISREALPNTLAAAFAAKPEDKVLYLKAHNARPYRDIMTMMDIGRDAGALVLAAVSESKSPPPGSEEGPQ